MWKHIGEFIINQRYQGSIKLLEASEWVTAVWKVSEYVALKDIPCFFSQVEEKLKKLQCLIYSVSFCLMIIEYLVN